MTVNPRRPVTTRATTSLGNVQPVRRNGSGKETGKTIDQMNAELAEVHDSQPMLTICSHCSRTFAGLTRDGRAWFRAHLADRHPEVKVPRRGRSGWVKSSPEDRAAAMVEVEARKAMLA